MHHVFQWLGFACWIFGALVYLANTRFSAIKFLPFVAWSFLVLTVGYLATISDSRLLHFAFTLSGLYKVYRVRHFILSEKFAMKTIVSFVVAVSAVLFCSHSFAADKTPTQDKAASAPAAKTVKGKKHLDLTPLTKEQARAARGGNR